MFLPSDATWFWPLLFAPFVGSFIGVLIVRLPVGRPAAMARSECGHCGTRLGAIDMAPLVSFIALGGRCRHCRAPIGLFHPAVELAALGVAVWAMLAAPDQPWTACVLGWTLLTLAWIDWESLLLPDVLTLPLLLAGLALTLAQAPQALTDHVLAAALAYLSFQAIAVAYHRLRGFHGLGGGDAKLLAAAGAWCGLAALPFVILASAVLGLIAALGLALSGRTMTSTTRIPFGPCIALGFWLAWAHAAWLDTLIQSVGRP